MKKTCQSTSEYQSDNTQNNLLPTKIILHGKEETYSKE